MKNTLYRISTLAPDTEPATELSKYLIGEMCEIQWLATGDKVELLVHTDRDSLTCDDPSPGSADADNLAWVTLDEVRDLDLHDGVIDIITEAYAHILLTTEGVVDTSIPAKLRCRPLGLITLMESSIVTVPMPQEGLDDEET